MTCRFQVRLWRTNLDGPSPLSGSSWRPALRTLSRVELIGSGLGGVGPGMPCHVDIAVGDATHVAREVIPQVELPPAVLAERLAVGLRVGRRLAHWSAQLVFIGLRLFGGREQL